MTTAPESIKQSVFELVNTCREKLKSGNVDMSQVEEKVRAYCDAIAALPSQEGQKHKDDLEKLMQLIGELGEELTAERDVVLEELNNLERMRKANVAYKNSDGRVVVKHEDIE